MLHCKSLKEKYYFEYKTSFKTTAIVKKSLKQIKVDEAIEKYIKFRVD